MASSSLPTKKIAGVTVVDTPLVQAAQYYARAHADDMTYNHVMRSWLFGAIIYSKLSAAGAFPPVDLEAHAISAIHHDLGWDVTGELISSDKRFEVDSAIAAREWIKTQHDSSKEWDEHRLQLIWDAIALHTTPSIAKYKEPVVGLCGLGIAADFLGPKSDPTGTLAWDEFKAVSEEFPRLDLAGGIRKILCGFCKTKPDTTYDNFMQAYGEKYVEGYRAQRSIDMVDNSIP